MAYQAGGRVDDPLSQYVAVDSVRDRLPKETLRTFTNEVK